MIQIFVYDYAVCMRYTEWNVGIWWELRDIFEDEPRMHIVTNAIDPEATGIAGLPAWLVMT